MEKIFNSADYWNLNIMRALFPLVLFIIGLHADVSAAEAPMGKGPAIDWIKPEGANVEPIFAQARQSNKPVFLYWGAVWCPPCNQIKADVFSRPDFAERSKQFVAVYIDGDSPGAQKLGAQFKVRGYPTMILFKPDASELTRIPGEVDAARYIEVLDLALASSSTVKESLATALGTQSAGLKPSAWRQLAFYAWDQDQAQLVSDKERTRTLNTLARNCLPLETEACTRLLFKSVISAHTEKSTSFAREQALIRIREVLSDPVLTRMNFDILQYYGNDLIAALSAKASPDRTALVNAMSSALDRLGKDATLSRSDRLGATQAKLNLARIDATDDANIAIAPALIAQVRNEVATVDRESTQAYERQALIPNAAHLLSQVGLLDESDNLLKAELPKAISPYYHMLVLASNAKKRGDKQGALDWSERSWKESAGPATRMQWGSGYVSKLIELAPQDSARIEKAAAGVIGELSPSPEIFYERNSRVLERMSKQLQGWSDKGQHADVIRKLAAQLEQVCSKLPAKDDSRKTCNEVSKNFKTRG
jgi:thioredoxin-related protein